MPTLAELNAADPAAFVAALANVFEHSPWIAEAAAGARPFATLAALRDAMTMIVREAAPETRLALIRAHPDLANKFQRDAGLTADSVSEQDGAGLDRLSEAELAAFEARNAAYKERFGFPFILCVRRHAKDSILRVFSDRLRNDAAAEEAAALGEVARIASLRLAELVPGDTSLKVHGHLSTHILDNHGGRAAEGVAVELVEVSDFGSDRVLVRAATDRDGRTGAALIHHRPVPIGTYELRYRIADYYRRRGAPLADPPFLDRVTVRFAVAEPEGRYHVPLLMTPWSYTTYRGS